MSSLMQEESEDKSFLNVRNLASNNKIIATCRTSLCAISGFATGVLGCTTITGLLAFISFHIIVSLALLAKMRFDLHKYTTAKKNSGYVSFIFEGIFGLVLTFILFWTLAYALVYVY